MFFLIAFGWLVAASFAFVLAILTPNWITIQTLVSTKNVTVHRGVFYVCDLVSTDSPFETKRCTSILEQTKSFEPFKWRYEYAISTASIAIGCAALSIIAVWLTGIYFNVRQRNRCTSCGLVMLSFFVLFIFCTSIVVWILLIVETLVLGYTVDTSTINWPLWLAVGASGGYLMSSLTMLISLCAVVRRQRRRDKDLLEARNQF